MQGMFLLLISTLLEMDLISPKKGVVGRGSPLTGLFERIRHNRIAGNE